VIVSNSRGPETLSELVAELGPGARVATAAEAAAGDIVVVTIPFGRYREAFGFDVVDAGPLAEGRRFQRDKSAYGPRFTVETLKDALAKG
jgi:predicted dinucleotide-binding enzyme